MKKLLLVGLVLSAVIGLWAAGSTEVSGAIAPDKAKVLLDSDVNAILLDVRTKEEFLPGHIERAKLFPYDTITKESAAAIFPKLDTPIIVYCRSGNRSGIAAKTLRELGYSKVFDMGSIANWKFGLVKGLE